MTQTRSLSRRSFVTLGISLVLLAVAGVLIVLGLRPDGAPAAAPLPATDFAVEVDDPTLGPLETSAAPAGPDDGTRIPDDHERAPERGQLPSAPVRDGHLVIPVLGVDAAIAALPLTEDRSLVLPEDVNRITLWDGSAPVDSDAGTLLVAGHVDNAAQGTGALYWIHTLQPGDVVYLADQGVVTRWKVTGMESVVKSALPQRIWAGPDGSRQLVMVTCGGELVRDAQGRGTYLDNVVVTAEPF